MAKMDAYNVAIKQGLSHQAALGRELATGVKKRGITLGKETQRFIEEQIANTRRNDCGA